jgi:hypothetical protein
MALTEDFAKKAHTSVMARESSGHSSDIAGAVKAVKRRVTEKECSEQSWAPRDQSLSLYQILSSTIQRLGEAIAVG